MILVWVAAIVALSLCKQVSLSTFLLGIVVPVLLALLDVVDQLRITGQTGSIAEPRRPLPFRAGTDNSSSLNLSH